MAATDTTQHPGCTAALVHSVGTDGLDRLSARGGRTDKGRSNNLGFSIQTAFCEVLAVAMNGRDVPL